jgi:hypothetical protein
LLFGFLLFCCSCFYAFVIFCFRRLWMIIVWLWMIVDDYGRLWMIIDDYGWDCYWFYGDMKRFVG